MQFKLFSLILFLLKVSTAEACKCAVTLDFSVKEIEKYAYIAVVKIGQKTPMDSSALTQRGLPYYFTAEIEKLLSLREILVNRSKSKVECANLVIIPPVITA
ncbi:hypothetical protein SAMN04488104_101455 [Algoriphagus faecimaris]|uniref:Uncharacterized protein n=1 Tax=Algoriphagus faecimaris TaxID=686796 RepID=A0A1G6RW56_9BACT|nr:hypothetical protein SAMN04488104_101455 [Algoriphagus faecimaris]